MEGIEEVGRVVSVRPTYCSELRCDVCGEHRDPEPLIRAPKRQSQRQSLSGNYHGIWTVMDGVKEIFGPMCRTTVRRLVMNCVLIALRLTANLDAALADRQVLDALVRLYTLAQASALPRVYHNAVHLQSAC